MIYNLNMKYLLEKQTATVRWEKITGRKNIGL